MKLISWNVNGLRSCMNKTFSQFFNEVNADFFCIQETKMQEEQKNFSFDGYYEYWSSAIKKGYSGTLIYAKEKPLNIVYGIDEQYNDEGRVITLEYKDLYLVNLYSPNSKEKLLRLDYRMKYEELLREYLVSLKKNKNVIVCGDFNVAHQEIDIKNPKANERNAGFTIEERSKFEQLLNAGFIDTFRYLNPNKVLYSWWSYRFNARINNAGWRIDYFLVNDNLKEKIKLSNIYTNICGSDHAPIELIIE